MKFAITTIILFISGARATLFGYRQDRNSTEPEDFQGLLAAFGLQLGDGQGVPGRLVVAKDASGVDDLLPSYACNPVKPAPEIMPNNTNEEPPEIGLVQVDKSHFGSFRPYPNKLQTVRHQSPSKLMQKLYQSACKSGVLSSMLEDCEKNQAIFNSILNVFALVRRGKCNFEEKAWNVQQAGFLGVIIYDPNNDGVIVMHGSHEYALNIPAMYVGRKTAIQLLEHYVFDPSELDVDNQPFLLMVSDDDSIINYLLPFTLIVAVCLLTMMVFSCLRVIRQWRAHRKARLTKRKLKKLPKKKYCKEADADWETCAICIEDYIDGDMLRILPCQHAYHVDCIDPWLTRSRRNCPLCKRSVLTSDEEDGDGRMQSLPSTSSSDVSQTDDSDETPLLIEEARDLARTSPTQQSSTSTVQRPTGTFQRIYFDMQQSITRRIRSISSSSVQYDEMMNDGYVAEDEDDVNSLSQHENDEQPLLVRTTLRRQGAIRRAPSSGSSSNAQITSDNAAFSSEDLAASDDELPITDDSV